MCETRAVPGKKKSDRNGPHRPPISLKQLAKHLELSPTTLSLVLNNSNGAESIPQATKDRIFAAAREFNYRPNFLARSLRAQRTYTIGILIPEFSEGYHSAVLSGVEDGLRDAGYIYLVSTHRRDPKLIEQYPMLMYERRAEGLIVIDMQNNQPLPLPAIAIAGHNRVEGVTNIVVDHDHAAELALRHLKDLQHTKIAFIRGPSYNSDAEVRWNSICLVAESLGMEIDPSLVTQIEGESRLPDCGYRAMRKLLDRRAQFTALFTFHDISAIGAIRAVRDAGLRIPEDVSVVGFDDIPAAQYLNPALTTIRQPMVRMGRLAAETLVDRIAHPSEPVPEELQVEPELVTRESTAQAREVPAAYGVRKG